MRNKLVFNAQWGSRVTRIAPVVPFTQIAKINHPVAMPPGDAESKTAFLKDCYIRFAALQQAPARSRVSPPTTISCAGALEPNPAEQNVPEAVECLSLIHI